MARKYHVRIAASAERDITEIRDWIAKDHPITAESFINELYDHTKTLEQFAERCPPIRENVSLKKSYRHLIHKKYRIIFRVVKNNVYIVRVLHGSRRLQKL